MLFWKEVLNYNFGISGSVYQSQFFLSSIATTILTSTLDGRQAACPAEVVTYTCNVTAAATISWTVTPIFVMESLVRFVPTTPLNQRVTCTTMQCAGFDFLATLTNVGPCDIMTGAADMTSTFRFTARAELNGTVVQCSGTTSPSTPSESRNFTVAGKCYHREVPSKRGADTYQFTKFRLVLLTLVVSFVQALPLNRQRIFLMYSNWSFTH